MKPTSTNLFSALILFVFIFLPHPLISNNSSPLEKKTGSKEKIYIHFDKSFYSSGENIWYKVYLVDAINHKPNTLSSVVYIDLIDPNNTIIDSKTIKINNGSGNGDFNLPFNLLKGEYTVRAYTNFMRNFDSACFFRKTIPINYIARKEIANTKNDLSLSFFPEGGNLVNGFVNSIGFKAINEEGKGVNVSGSILDETGKTIRTFKSSKFGLGMFQFVPRKGKHYKATILYKDQNLTYKLPSITDQGILMRVFDSNDSFRVIIYSSLPNNENNLKLIGLQKGEIVCQTEFNGNKSEVAIKVPKSNLKLGIIEFRLLDKNDTVLSKELAFSGSNSLMLNATIETSKHIYKMNEVVEVDINLTELIQKNETVNMSISVTEIPPLKTATYASGIKSYLFLNSEVKEDIEQSGYYFNSNDLQKKNELTLLLRSLNVNHDLFKDIPKNTPLEFSPESNFSLKGTIKEKNNEKPVKANVTIFYKNNKELGYDKTITDSLGRFLFKDLYFDERTHVSIKANPLKARYDNRTLTIALDTFIPPLINSKLADNHLDKTNTLLPPKVRYHRNIDFAPQEGEIKLDEVKLNATKKALDRYNEKRKLALYREPSHSLDFKNIRLAPPMNPLLALQGKFAGVTVYGETINIRGSVYLYEGGGEPLFLIDGITVSKEDFITTPISDIDFIDILKGSRAAIYGMRAGNGVVALYTLTGREKIEEQNNLGVIKFYHSGFYKTKVFDQTKNNSSVLYWNPDIKLHQSNKAKISFNTVNKSATYKILLEGITSNGIPFKSEVYFDVK
ncbi:TonB-dependent receptor plug domain-containing protein [Aestuariivivens insulae]|uniref:TonB-dependent receptor plug domain-containing protein n=1 Tax=Aestuariivivens insulae TaxID=1621988 RepID=UPI001F55FE79|nr:TonB-dependent receptor plug domain-containing protein [Aestuariivivens insulae]